MTFDFRLRPEDFPRILRLLRPTQWRSMALIWLWLMLTVCPGLLVLVGTLPDASPRLMGTVLLLPPAILTSMLIAAFRQGIANGRRAFAETCVDRRLTVTDEYLELTSEAGGGRIHWSATGPVKQTRDWVALPQRGSSNRYLLLLPNHAFATGAARDALVAELERRQAPWLHAPVAPLEGRHVFDTSVGWQAEFTLATAEVVQLTSQLVVFSDPLQRRRRIGLLLAIAGFVVTLAMLERDGGGAENVVRIALAIATILICNRLAGWLRTFTVWLPLADRSLLQPQRLLVHPLGIVHDSPQSQQFIPWSQVAAVLSGRDLIAFRTVGSQMVGLPRRLLDDHAAAELVSQASAWHQAAHEQLLIERQPAIPAAVETGNPFQSPRGV